jgi:hypothetical protein
MTDFELAMREALDNALENGYDITTWTVEAMMFDLMMCCADADGAVYDELKPIVERWLADKKT